MIEEYLNNLKADIGHKCTHHIEYGKVFLEILSYERLSTQEFGRIREILKTWTYLSNTAISDKMTYIYSFGHYDLKQEIRSINLKELI